MRDSFQGWSRKLKPGRRRLSMIAGCGGKLVLQQSLGVFRTFVSFDGNGSRSYFER